MKIHNKIIFIFIIIVYILFIYSTKESFSKNLYIDKLTNNNLEAFPSKEEIIIKLCCDEFNGRCSGSKGNELTENYIANLYEYIKLTPIIRNNFKQSFICNIKTKDNYKKVYLNNIIGKINGNNNDKAIVISAHFDHIGNSNNGELVKGAVDNASGTAILISLAKALKDRSNNNPFDFDIVFAAFNGEELGLAGSKVFCDNQCKYYNKIYNINIDCVGYKNGGNIILTNNYNKINKIRGDVEYERLYFLLKDTFEKKLIPISKTIEVRGMSDDFSFQFNGHTSICIIEENILEIIHTVNDTPNVIDFNKLNLIEDALVDFICNFKF